MKENSMKPLMIVIVALIAVLRGMAYTEAELKLWYGNDNDRAPLGSGGGRIRILSSSSVVHVTPLVLCPIWTACAMFDAITSAITGIWFVA